MSNSPLVSYTRLSPNHSGLRSQRISKIAIHHTAGAISLATLGAIFAPRSRQASSTYGVDNYGKVGMYCEEKNHPWTTSSYWVDARAVTIEVCNSSNGGNWPVSDAALEGTIKLCVDICLRNNIYPCTYTGDSRGTLIMHKWYAQTSCPGPYLGSKFSYIAKEVTRRLAAIKSGGAAKPAPAKPAPAPATTKIKAGDQVTITGTNYATGQRIPDWAKKRTHTVSKIAGDRALLGHAGGINSWLYLKDLKAAAAAAPAPKPKPAPAPAKPAGPTYHSYPPGVYQVLPAIGLNIRNKPDTGDVLRAMPKGTTFNAVKEIRGGVNGVWLQLQGGGYACAQAGNNIYVKRIGNLPAARKSNAQIAQEVYEGQWGNNPERKRRLEAAGYNYATIQALVNAKYR